MLKIPVVKNNLNKELEGLSLFRKGIRPTWEDEKNKKGGEVSCN